MSDNREGDIIAHIVLHNTNDGGRSIPTPSHQFRCPLKIEEELFDCALLLQGSLRPGDEATVPIVFLSPKIVLPLLRVGSRFALWERGEIGVGTVEEILRTV